MEKRGYTSAAIRTERPQRFALLSDLSNLTTSSVTGLKVETYEPASWRRGAISAPVLHCFMRAELACQDDFVRLPIEQLSIMKSLVQYYVPSLRDCSAHIMPTCSKSGVVHADSGALAYTMSASIFAIVATATRTGTLRRAISSW